MAISERNLDSWILPQLSSNGHGVAKALFPVLLLQFFPYVVGQAENGGPYNGSRPHNIPLIVLGMLIFSLIFSMLACSLCYKFCVSPPATADDVETGGRGGWQRRTGRGGLHAEAIESFPSFLYSEVKGLKIGRGGEECAVCLSGFEDGETLRLMPPCSHVFHADCVDVWLSSRSTCPVCRANLRPKPGESVSYPSVGPDGNLGTGSETGNMGSGVLESPDRSLIDGVTWIGRNRPPRSLSTGLSSWRIGDMIFPRSHSTGHSLVQLGENLDRFTLQLPEEVQRQLIRLNRTTSHVALPQVRSSRNSYRSGSVGNERSAFPYGRQSNRRAISLSFSFSFRTASARSSPSRSDHTAPPKGPSSRPIKLPFQNQKTVSVQGKDGDFDERSFERPHARWSGLHG